MTILFLRGLHWTDKISAGAWRQLIFNSSNSQRERERERERERDDDDDDYPDIVRKYSGNILISNLRKCTSCAPHLVQCVKFVKVRKQFWNNKTGLQGLEQQVSFGLHWTGQHICRKTKLHCVGWFDAMRWICPVHLGGRTLQNLFQFYRLQIKFILPNPLASNESM